MLDAQADVVFHKVFEHKESRALGLIFGKDADKEGFRGVIAPRRQGGKEVDPSEGKDLALCLPHCGRYMGHCDGEANKFIFLVDHKGNKVLVENGNVLVHVAVYLLLGEFCVLVKAGEGLVEHVEHLTAALCHLMESAGGVDADAETLRDLIGKSEHGRKFRRDVHHPLGPVHIFGKAQALQVFRIIRIVVDDGEGALVLEAFHKKAFPVHICKAQRALDLCCTPYFAPFNHGVNEGLAHVEVLDEVYPAEADGILIPFLVGVVIDDGGYAACNLSVLIGQIKFTVTELQGGVFGAKRLVFVVFKCRDPFVRSLVQLNGKIYEFLKHFLPGYGKYGYRGFSHIVQR